MGSLAQRDLAWLSCLARLAIRTGPTDATAVAFRLSSAKVSGDANEGIKVWIKVLYQGGINANLTP
jgi:hypothetical protein